MKNNNRAYDRVDTIGNEKEYNSYQNFTSKFNILYNANLMLDNEAEQIFHAAKQNFQIRQAVFNEPAQEYESHPMMDSLIQKAYKIVNKKQESKYVNEAYFIIGKANYLKGSYHTSIEFFNHILRSTADQKQYLPLAYAWKSRALLQIGKVTEAKRMIDSAFLTIDEDKSTRTFVNAAMANYLIRNGEELKGIPYLEFALESNSNTLDKQRWTFLLAQLYRDNGQIDKALTSFSKISKSNVPYDMAFEASLQSSFLEGQKYANIDERVKPLLRMLREGKNDGYEDQILYHIGEVYLQNKKDDQAITYYQRSLAEPQRNNYQATETYLRLADYYYGKKQYFYAQSYYDSAAFVLPSDYTDVNKVRRKLGYMDEINTILVDIAQKDTLLTLAQLDESERDNRLNQYANVELLKEKAKVEKSKALSKSKKRSSINNNNGQSQLGSSLQILNQDPLLMSSSDRTFYFNNPDELLLGQSSFKRRWGNRQQKDNWRYEADNSVKLPQTSTNTKFVETESKDKDGPFDENKFVESIKGRYLSSIPKDTDEKDQMNKSIHDNLIKVGNIYRDYTQNNIQAIESYEEFLKRYPNSVEGASIYYSLYRMYDGVDNHKSIQYKNQLISLYPSSLHAKVAEDPAYMDKYRRDKNILDRLFERLFALYASGDHVAVIEEANRELQARFDNTALVAQVEYLRALAVGRVGRLSDFTSALSAIVQKYPQDSLVTPLAKENIYFIEQNPGLFVNRVNALQDRDNDRVAFIDEPNMTPWPSLNINGDYRTSVAIVTAKPKLETEKKKEATIKEEKKKEEVVIAKGEEKKAEVKKEEVVIAKVEEKKADAKKEELIKEALKIQDPEKDIKVVAEKEVIKAAIASEQTEEVKVALKELEKLQSQQIRDANKQAQTNVTMEAPKLNVGVTKVEFGPNEYRDKKLFPDSADYFFVINVMDVNVNLAPSRYGIGQYNRTRYQNLSINHQLKNVNGENQLLFIGPFKKLEDVKAYEARILPMMSEIMKVPSENYNTFVITKEVIPSLTDGVTIKKYHQNYIEQ